MSLPRNCTELHMVLQEYASSTCYHPCNGRARTVRTQVLDAITWQRRQVRAMLIDGWRVTATDKPDAVGQAAATAGQSAGRAGGQSDGKAGERAPAADTLADGRMLQARRDRRGLRALRGSGGGAGGRAYAAGMTMLQARLKRRVRVWVAGTARRWKDRRMR